MQQRSTKGASRQRRELINSEIMKIRSRLPVAENVRSHLSQLQVMSLCNTYVAKCNFFGSAISMQGCLFEDLTSFVNPQYLDHSELFPGFLTMVTLEGKVLYLSENVIEYLGHSMVDVLTHIDTFYDLIDNKDHRMLRDILVGMKSGVHSQDEWSFTCRMGVTKKFQQNFSFYDQKSMIVRGFFTTSHYNHEFMKPVFVALCSPRLKMGIASEPGILFDTMIFESLHELDMKFLDISSNGELHLGYSKDEIQFRSWYEFIHPDDSSRSVAVHKKTLYRDSYSWSPLVVRVQRKDGRLMWISMLMKKVNNINSEGRGGIYCVNQIVREHDIINEFEAGLMKTSFGEELLSSTATGLSQDVSLPSSGTEEGFLERKCSSSREEVIQKLKRKMKINEMKRKKACVPNDNVSRSQSLSPKESSASVFDFSPKKIAAFNYAGMGFQKNARTGSVRIEYSPSVRQDSSSCSSLGSVFKYNSPLTPASNLSSPNSCELSITCPRDDAFDCVTSLPTPKLGKFSKYPDQDVYESGNPEEEEEEEDFAVIFEGILDGSSFHDDSGKDLESERDKRVGDLPILCPGTIDDYFEEFEASSLPSALENVFELDDCCFASVGVNCTLPAGQTLLDNIETKYLSPSSSGKKMEKFWPEVNAQAVYSLGMSHDDRGRAAFGHILNYGDDMFQLPTEYPWNGFSDFLMAG